MNCEEWRPIASDPNYEVSNTGKIRRAAYVLSPWEHRSGHLYVRLTGGARRQIGVHRAVIEAFGGPHAIGQECRHIDGDPKNNHISNLAWGSRRDNIEDYVRLHSKYPRAKLTFAEVEAIRARLAVAKRGERKAIATDFGVSIHTINDIATKRRSVRGVAA